MITKNEIAGSIQALAALAEAIRGLGSVSSGQLYAQVMGHMDLPTFEKAIRLLEKTGIVRVSNHELTWIG